MWLDLLFKTELSAEHKLVGVAISRTCAYNRRESKQLSEITPYSISRIIKEPSDKVSEIITELENLGWIFDTGVHKGARRVFALSFSLLPLGRPKT
jgi:hypothetical protein